MKHSQYCVTADTYVTADPGVGSLIPAWSHTLVEIDHETISVIILLLQLIQEGFFVSYKGKYVHNILINPNVKLAQEKLWIGEMIT